MRHSRSRVWCLFARLVLILPLLLAVPVWAGLPVAVIANLQGAVTQRQEPAAGAAAKLLDPLEELAILTLAANARATLYFPASGKAFELRGPGDFEVGTVAVRALGKAPPPSGRDLNAAYRDIKLDRKPIAKAAVIMRGRIGEPSESLLEPRGLVLSPDNLTFRWVPQATGALYRFQLTNEMGKPLYETETLETSIGLPEWMTLMRGERYRWEVEVVSGNGGALKGWREFVVADEAMRSGLAELDRSTETMSEAERTLFRALREQYADEQTR